MSIATEISRLQTAKTNIKTAIENQGVTVPSSALLSTYNTYISQISGGGSSGLTYETGTWEPSEDIARGSISFSGTYSEAPFYVSLVDATGTSDTTTNSNMAMDYVDYYKLWGVGYPYSSSAWRYGMVKMVYRGTNTSSLSSTTTQFSYPSTNSGTTGTGYPRYWVTETGFNPYGGGTSRYWRTGRTYKWIAVWI